jgi:hypothetical protein
MLGIAVLVVAAALVAIVGSSAPGGASTTKDTKPLPAGRYPSKVSKEVCKSDAPHDVGEALGEKPTVTAPTWVNHLYSCTYKYPNAKMTLTVKELSNPRQTTAYFNSLGARLGVARKLNFLGQGAFQTTNGSVVVRKDYKVLLVDDTGLPAKFGTPPTTPGNIAVTVADVVLGCWAGD